MSSRLVDALQQKVSSTKKVGDTYRGPSGAEAEEADHVAVQEVFDLCFAGCSMDDALHQVSVERDILRHLLVSVPKPMRSDRPKGEGKGTGKGKPLKRNGLPDGPAENMSRPKRRLPLPPASKKPRSGECFAWMDGRCSDPNCRFKHVCASCGSSQHDSRSCPQSKE